MNTSLSVQSISIKGVSAVRSATSANRISPSLSRKLNIARREYKNGETTICHSPEDMNRYFGSL